MITDFDTVGDTATTIPLDIPRAPRGTQMRALSAATEAGDAACQQADASAGTAPAGAAAEGPPRSESPGRQRSSRVVGTGSTQRRRLCVPHLRAESAP